MIFQKNNTMWGIWIIAPKENYPQVRVEVWVRVRVSFRVRGQPGNCPGGKLLVRVRVWVRVSFGVEGEISFRGNCPRTIIWAVPIISLAGYDIIWYACDERKLFFPFRFESCFSGGPSIQLGTFYFLLIRTEWSWLFYHFHFFWYFSKDL